MIQIVCASLAAALKLAIVPTVFQLPPTPCALDIENVHAPGHTIVGGKFTSFKVINSSGLRFTGADYDASKTAPNAIAFIVANSKSIRIENSTIHGDKRWTVAQAASGFVIRDSQNIFFMNNEMSYLHSAFAHLNDTSITIAGNSCHNLFDDCIRGGGSSFVTIAKNRSWDNHPDAADADHPDFIQFWTSNTKASAHDITITNNSSARGTGHATHGIFMRDEVGTLPYINVTITGNNIYGPAWHGITLMGFKHAVITGNHVIAVCAIDDGAKQRYDAWITTAAGDDLYEANNVGGAWHGKGFVTNQTGSGDVKEPCLDKEAAATERGKVARGGS